MGNAVAQQVLKRGCHAVQQAAVHLDGCTQQVKFDLLACVFGGLPHHAVQPVRNTFKLHHAGLEQVALQLACLARLGNQIVFSCLNGTLQGALHGSNVVNRLGHHAGDFLHAGKAVKLQRVKSGLQFLGLGQTRLHLGFSLQFNVTQLLSQAVQVVRHVAE